MRFSAADGSLLALRGEIHRNFPGSLSAAYPRPASMQWFWAGDSEEGLTYGVHDATLRYKELRFAARCPAQAGSAHLVALAAAGDRIPSAEAEPSAPVFAVELAAGAWIGSLSGCLQTSKGGGAGTTSIERPKLEEIGLDGIQALPTVDTRLRFLQHHELHVSCVFVDIEGDAVLAEDLTSQAVDFPAGSPVESSLTLHMIRLGYRFGWLFPELSGWRFVPEVGVSIDPFAYELRSPSVAGRVDRSYNVAFPYYGLLVEGPIWGDLRGEIDVAGGAGVNGATLLDVDARLAYPLIASHGFRAALVLGLRGTWFRRRDHQSPLYNDINILMGTFSSDPWAGLTAGLRVEF